MARTPDAWIGRHTYCRAQAHTLRSRWIGTKPTKLDSWHHRLETLKQYSYTVARLHDNVEGDSDDCGEDTGKIQKVDPVEDYSSSTYKWKSELFSWY